MIQIESIDKLDLIDKLFSFLNGKSQNQRSSTHPSFGFRTNRQSSSDNVSFKVLCDFFDGNNHPEALRMSKTSNDLKNDLIIYWDKDKEDDIITKRGFFNFFDDISQSLSLEDFKSVLGCFGYNYKD